MARFLIYTGPEVGHLCPIVPTLLALRARGHVVAVRTAEPEVQTLRNLGLRASAIDPRIARREVRAFSDHAQWEIPDLQQAIKQENPDALLVDATCWGAGVAADASGLPWAFASHFCLPIPSRDAPPYGVGLAPHHDSVGRLRDAVVRRVIFAPLEAIVANEINRLRQGMGLHPGRTAADRRRSIYSRKQESSFAGGDWRGSHIPVAGSPGPERHAIHVLGGCLCLGWAGYPVAAPGLGVPGLVYHVAAGRCCSSGPRPGSVGAGGTGDLAGLPQQGRPVHQQTAALGIAVLAIAWFGLRRGEMCWFGSSVGHGPGLDRIAQQIDATTNVP